MNALGRPPLFRSRARPRARYRWFLAFEALEARALLSGTMAAQLVVTTPPPAAVAAGAEFAVVVAAEDGSGHVDTSDDASVMVTLANSPTGAMLGGTLTQTLVAGVATFSDLTVSEPGSGNSLQLTSGNLAPATTRTFDVASGPVASVELSPIPGPPSLVTATAAVSAAPGDPVSLTYTWEVNGNVVGVDSGAYRLSDTFDLSGLANIQIGDAVTVIVTPSDPTGDGTSAVATAVVGYPGITLSVSLNPTAPTVGQTVSAAVTVIGAGSDSGLALTYDWYLSGGLVQTTADTPNLTDMLDLDNLSTARKRDQITVVVTPSVAGLTGAAVSASAVIADSPAAASVSFEPEDPALGQPPTAVVTASDPDGDTVLLTYVWTDTTTGQLLQTTSNTSILTDSLDPAALYSVHVGDVITVQVTPYDRTLYGATVTATTTLADTAPVADSATVSLSHRSSMGIDIPLIATAVGGSPVSFSLVGPNGGAMDGTVTLTGNAAHYTPTQGVIGTDTFQFTASDGTLTSLPATVTVNLTNTPPVVANPTPGNVIENNALTINAPGVLSGATDADGDPLTAVLMTGPSHGTVMLHPDGSFVYTPTANYTGIDSFTFVASDGAAASNVGTAVLDVADLPPTANDVSYTVDVGGTLTVPAPGVLAGASDANGNPLQALVVSGPAHGSLSLHSDGSFVYTAEENFVGIDIFSYAVFDGTDLSNVATVTIAPSEPMPPPPVSEVPPVAGDDAYSGTSDTPLVIAAPGVLANDTGTSGDKLTAVVMSQPSDGTLALNSDGSFTYTPDVNFAGTDSFTYVASDGAADSNVATVTLKVTDTPPVAANDGPYHAIENNPLWVPLPGVLANDTHTAGSTLTAQLIAQANHGTVTLNPNGSFIYAPDSSFTGSDTFTYQAFDGIDKSNVATVSLVVNDKAPILVNQSYTVVENRVLTVSAASGALDGGTVFNNNPLVPEVVTDPAHGGLTLQSDGSFVYTPSVGFTGTDSFTVLASDGTDLSNLATESITITPGDIPVAQASAFTTPPGTPLTIAAPGVLANDRDPVGGLLSAVLVVNPLNGTLTLGPDGSFTYVPDPGFTGNDGFTYEASNGSDASDPVAVTLRVTPGPTATGGQPATPAPTPTIPVSGRFTPAPGAPVPALAPPLVTGVANLVFSRGGVSAITLAFNEAINPDSLVDLRYSVLGGVTRHRKAVYSKIVPVTVVSFDDPVHLTIHLARPYKGKVRVTLSGILRAANGTSSNVGFVATAGTAGA
jgi:VCBS repeat-containing protein